MYSCEDAIEALKSTIASTIKDGQVVKTMKAYLDAVKNKNVEQAQRLAKRLLQQKDDYEIEEIWEDEEEGSEEFMEAYQKQLIITLILSLVADYGLVFCGLVGVFSVIACFPVIAHCFPEFCDGIGLNRCRRTLCLG